jgi:hypothetical protein
VLKNIPKKPIQNFILFRFGRVTLNKVQIDIENMRKKNEQPNILQMYMMNNCKLGFYVTRNSWANGKTAKVISIEGVEEGKPIEGTDPYFNEQLYPEGDIKAGKKMTNRNIKMVADWFDNGTYETEAGACYGWTFIDTEIQSNG